MKFTKHFKPCMLAILFSFIAFGGLRAQDPIAIESALSAMESADDLFQLEAAHVQGDVNYVKARLSSNGNGNNSQVSSRLGDVGQAIDQMAPEVASFVNAAHFVGSPMLIHVADNMLLPQFVTLSSSYNSVMLSFESGVLETSQLDALANAVNEMKHASGCIRREIQTIRNGL